MTKKRTCETAKRTRTNRAWERRRTSGVIDEDDNDVGQPRRSQDG